jgi:hypothetical protein
MSAEHEIMQFSSAPGYRDASLKIDGKEVSFSAEQVLEVWAFFGDVLGIAWAHGAPLDLTTREHQEAPAMLAPQMEKWRAVRRRMEGGQD